MVFLTYLRNISLKSAYYIIILSAISGIAGGALLILYPNAAIHIFNQNSYIFYLTILPPISCIFILSKRLSQKKTASIVEQSLEDQILSIVNTIRHDELANFEKRKRSDIFMSIVNAQTITQAATKSIDAIEHNITLIIGWIYIFVFLSSFFAWIILAWRFVHFLFKETFQKIIKSIILEELKEQKDLFRIFETYLYGFKELKFHKKKSDELYEKNFVTLTEKIKLLRTKCSFYTSELQVFYSLSVFFLLGSSVFLFSTSFTRETTLKIVIMMLYMMKTDIMILSQIPYIMEGKAALDRMQQLFSKTAMKDKTQTLFDLSKEPIKGVNSITMENIRFSYPSISNESNTESGFSVEIDHLDIKSGEILFIIGGNGSGKSTLINILTGLYYPQAGKIRIDDHLVQMNEHRYLFSSVFADFHLFNSIYGMDDISDDKVNEILKLMDLSSKTSFRKGCFSSLNLSAGQKKRLALAIALVEDKPIYIFDEWAADQDQHFRRYFYEKLLPMLKAKGKIIISITHDDQYFYMADQIIKMEYGKIIESFRPDIKESASHLFLGNIIPMSSEEKQSPQEKKKIRIPPISRKRRKTVNKEKQPKGIIEQIKLMMQSHGTLIKKLMFLTAFVSFSLVFIFITILSAAHPSPGQSRNILFFQFIILIILYVISFRRLNRQFYNSVEDRIANFRTQALNLIRRTSLMMLEQIGTRKIYVKLTSDIKAISDTSLSVLLSLFGAARTLIVFIYIAFLSLPAFLIMALSLFIGGIFYTYNQSLMLELFKQIRDKERQLFESINDLLEGFKELRLNNKKSDDFYLKSLKYHTSTMRELRLSSSNYYTNNYTIAYALWEIMLLSTTLLLPFLTPSAGVLPITVAMIITIPLNQVIDRYSHFHTAYMSLKQLYQFEDEMKAMTLEEMKGRVNQNDLGKYEELNYDSISFRYNTSYGHPFYIGPLNISFKPGEIIFITGGNGSGKSTLLKLITGLYPKDTGKISLDVKEVDIRLYQELFSAVFTDFYLFDRLYGMEVIDEAKLKSLLERFQLDKKVQYTGGKFSTLDLSTGQKKRLSLIITILEDKPIFIFDEWAADQDPYFRNFFYMTLLPEFKNQGKTVIAVTHDDRFFCAADRVIRIEYGQIS